jgi:hypothetical protein
VKGLDTEEFALFENEKYIKIYSLNDVKKADGKGYRAIKLSK